MASLQRSVVGHGTIYTKAVTAKHSTHVGTHPAEFDGVLEKVVKIVNDYFFNGCGEPAAAAASSLLLYAKVKLHSWGRVSERHFLLIKKCFCS